jgi:PHD/YefM family antitoxin component YafN of YafNO toxin-antitoxin module
VAKVTAAELQTDFARFRELARHEPVSVMENGEESVVMLSADEYRRLKAADTREALYVWELSDAEIQAMDPDALPPDAAEFDHEYKRRGSI